MRESYVKTLISLNIVGLTTNGRIWELRNLEFWKVMIQDFNLPWDRLSSASFVRHRCGLTRRHISLLSGMFFSFYHIVILLPFRGALGRIRIATGC